MNRKHLSRLLASVLCFTALAGCTRPSSDKDPASKKEHKSALHDNVSDQIPISGKPDKDQFIRTFANSQPTTIDPSKGSDLYGNTILYNTTEPLIRIQDKKDGKIGEISYLPAGAKSWDKSQDGKTYTFHLRKNFWHDGKPVTASDYAYGIRRSAAPETACPYANLLFYIKNGEAVNTGKKDLGALGVKALDDYTLEITLEHPTAYFIDIVTQRTYFPQRKDWVEKHGDSYSTTPETLPQCGPFLLKDWTINSEQNFVKNPDYWDADNIRLSRFHVAVIQEPNTVYQALKSGEIDFANVLDPKWKAQFFKSDAFYHVTCANPDTAYFTINCQKNANLSNAKMRQAVSIALDRKELIDATMHGIPIPAYDFVPPTVSNLGLTFNKKGTGCVRELSKDHPDPKALFIEGLKEAGLSPDPADFKLHYLGSGTSQNARLVSEFIKQNLEDVLGITVDVKQMEWNQFINAMHAHNYDLAHLAWSADYNDPSNFLEICYSKSSLHDSGYKNAAFDKLIEAAQKESDPKKRGKLLHDAEHIILYEDPALIPVNHRVTHSFRKTYIRNVNISRFCTTGLRDAYTSGRK